jgi:hypothetical protein
MSIRGKRCDFFAFILIQLIHMNPKSIVVHYNKLTYEHLTLCCKGIIPNHVQETASLWANNGDISM